MPSLRFRVTGRVQGVGFRAWTRKTAIALGVTGWVRNDPDGAVTGVICGAPADVAAMVRRLHDGPRFGRVDTVETTPTDGPTENPTADQAPGAGFQILR